jgi:hypothetical protein
VQRVARWIIYLGVFLAIIAFALLALRYLDVSLAQSEWLRDLAFCMIVGGTLLSVLGLLPLSADEVPAAGAVAGIVILLAGLAFSLAALDVLSRSKGAPLAAAPRAPNIEAAWVQIIPIDPDCEEAPCDAQALLRVVLPAKAGDCAAAAVDVATNQPLPLRARGNPRPGIFRILLCEAVLPLNHPGARLADGTTLGWSRLDQRTPRVAAILGDSGCDPKKHQDCMRPTGWPLPRIAMQAASMDEGGPDLVVHLGDFRYRGDDDWPSWRDDFFAPARPLLVAAPWIMARGNHDNCFGDHGDGWVFLLDPTPYGPTPCTKSQNDAEPRIEQSYALDLGDLRVIVLDTADAKYRCKRYREEFEAKHLKHFQKMLDGAGRGSGRALWLVSHYPVFDARTPPDAPCDPDNNPKEAAKSDQPKKFATVALRDIVAEKAIAARVQTVLSGDQHNFQVIPIEGPAGTSLLQLVIGDSGTKLETLNGTEPQRDSRLPPGQWCKATIPGAAGEVLVRGRDVYGFVAAVLKESNWRFDLRAARSVDQQGEIPSPNSSKPRSSVPLDVCNPEPGSTSRPESPQPSPG